MALIPHPAGDDDAPSIRPRADDRRRPALRALIVVNPVAPHYDPAALRQALDAAFGNGYRLVETPPVAALDMLRSEVKRAVEESCDLVLAAGGDGTVSQLADVFAGLPESRQVAIGIIPLGTTNLLARELLVPIDLARALEVAITRRAEKQLDTIRCGDQHFLTQVGVGVDAQMIRETNREAQKSLGRLAYMRSLLRAVPAKRSHRFVLEIDGARVRVRAVQVVVANAGTLGTPPFRWGPGIDPADGILNVCVFDVRSFRDHFWVAWRLLTGRAGNDEATHFYRVRREVRINSSSTLPVQGDGEPIGPTPITLRVAPATLRVIVPAPAEATEEGSAASLRGTPDTKRRSALRRIGSIDASLFLYLNALPRSRMVSGLVLRASRLMDLGEGWIVVSLVAGLVRRDPSLPIIVTGALWMTMLTVNYPIKALFRRTRPFVTHVDTLVIGRRPSDWSFPSGHTAAAFGGALLLSLRLPPLGPWCYAYATIVGLSRIYLGVHYPVDVVIGAAIGTILALIYGAGLDALILR